MSWKNSLTLRIILPLLAIALSIFLFLASALLGMAIYDEYTKYQEAWEDGQKKNIKKEHLEQEVSPQLTKRVITYKLNNESLFKDQIIMAVEDLNIQKEDYIFIGEERKPKWLDDDHVFFTSYCGTACKGIYLIDIRNKEVKLATLSYIFSDNNSWETHFKDWFGKEFQFSGLVEDIGTLFENDNYFLVFQTKDQASNHLREKKFIFTGENLVEQ